MEAVLFVRCDTNGIGGVGRVDSRIASSLTGFVIVFEKEKKKKLEIKPDKMRHISGANIQKNSASCSFSTQTYEEMSDPQHGNIRKKLSFHSKARLQKSNPIGNK
eukprot:gb/GEZN01012501.1/.p4 GENE.gb/GEZN01012501.1/~~gb/GEZN01012501.1/.p4  ORF type:complete len:105 (+),score=9.59 gb/GEZN01012501.1/:754-1068(+)